MISLTQLTELLGWVSILNIGFLLFATIVLASAKSIIVAIHSKMFDIPKNELPVIYFKYLANYKTLSLVFIIFPYIALKIMGQ